VQTSAQPLVGRDRDVAALEAFLAGALREGGAVLVTGDAGVGKTALVDVVAANARRRGVRVLHDNVAGLVYIAGFAPDQGESVSTLIADPPPGAPVPPILPPHAGFLLLDREQFAASFAADVPAAQAAFLADAQVPWGLDALNGPVSRPAWRTKPSWYLVTTEDRMIPPLAQRAMAERAGATVTEVAGSHAVYVSQPGAVADFIASAARSLREPAGALR
jgi:pimeloyl-ACP methyl ester carboxylesterase